MNKNIKIEIAVGIILVVAIIIGGAFWLMNKNNAIQTQNNSNVQPVKKVACTEEAKQCPDGSYVTRTETNCEFAPCPSEALCEGGACPETTAAKDKIAVNSPVINQITDITHLENLA